jgi:hypothetical protein
MFANRKRIAAMVTATLTDGTGTVFSERLLEFGIVVIASVARAVLHH